MVKKRSERTRNSKVCGAKTRKGVPCQSPPMLNGRCRLHGGPTPKGNASPHIIHGRYSRYLPQGLSKCFKESIDDPDLLKLTEEINLIDARIRELLLSMAPDEEGVTKEKSEIDKIWRQILAVIEQRRKLVTDERKYQIDSHQVITGERLMRLMEFILGIITKYVKDPASLRGISNDLGELLSGPTEQ